FPWSCTVVKLASVKATDNKPQQKGARPHQLTFLQRQQDRDLGKAKVLHY
ncbi:unnamed protein product, partial [Urochloa humidicola]